MVFFHKGEQQLRLQDVSAPGEKESTVDIYFRPDRAGKQEKYVQVKSKADPRLEEDITIVADVCYPPRLEHLGMALVKDKKYFGQMMDSQKPLKGAIQVDVRDNAVQDYKIPFRCMAQDEDSFSSISFKFGLADSKRQWCSNLRLEGHDIELSIRKQNLTLQPNRPKVIVLRVIRANSVALTDASDPNVSINSSTLSATSKKSSKKQNKTALACLVAKPCDTETSARPAKEPESCLNYAFVLRLNY